MKCCKNKAKRNARRRFGDDCVNAMAIRCRGVSCCVLAL
jgi:hypothetical protein